ncbi:hypothetical protein AB0J42_03490 [Nonomuraea sp. NPDC049649]|uniref:hypothetical protein n=1 Tax=Nonomuraea sp. NPDC049649 TaxID=3155776 RepID=UPI003412F06C
MERNANGVAVLLRRRPGDQPGCQPVVGRVEVLLGHALGQSSHMSGHRVGVDHLAKGSPGAIGQGAREPGRWRPAEGEGRLLGRMVSRAARMIRQMTATVRTRSA